MFFGHVSFIAEQGQAGESLTDQQTECLSCPPPNRPGLVPPSLSLQFTPPAVAWQPAGLAYSICGDIKLYNKKDLCDQLQLPGDCDKIDDTALVIEAYLRWGEQVAEHLVGDFAFLLVDRKRRQVVACRDHIGVKHFFFLPVETGSPFVFSGSLDTLRRHCASANVLNTDYLVAYLRREHPASDSTVYNNVRQLAPASCLVLRSTGWQVRRYWTPKIGPKAKGKGDSIPEFRKLLTEVIRSRLPNTGRVGQLFSGGLDSTLLLYSLLPLCRERGENPALFSFIANSPPTADNDQKYIDIALVDTGLSARYCSDGPATVSRDTLEQFFNRRGTFAWTPFLNRTLPLLNLVAAEPPACLFSGVGGDEIVTLSPQHTLIFMAMIGEWRSLPRHLLIRARRARITWLHAVLRWLVFPLLPEKIQQAYAKFRRNDSTGRDYDGCFLCQPHHERRLSKRKSASDLPWWRRFDPRSEIVETITSGYFISTMAMAEANSETMGCLYAMPLLDKRIIEFCLAMPGEEFVKDDIPRVFARNVMKGIVPDEMANRMTKTLLGVMDVDLMLANAELFAEILNEESEIAWQILDRDKMAAGFETLQGLAVTSAHARQLGHQLSKCLNVAAFVQWFEKEGKSD